MKVVVLNNFAIGQTHLGKAVFAGRSFKKNDVITKFEGEIVPKSKLPKSLKGERDRYVQVGLDHFMGPSGKIDDLINHSCNPNAGLKFTETGVLLVSLKKIGVGEEVTWDYSTTLFDSNWRMKCDCREARCRGIVADFALLDQELQLRYRVLDILPPYIRDYMESPEYPVYTNGIRKLRKYDAEKR